MKKADDLTGLAGNFGNITKRNVVYYGTFRLFDSLSILVGHREDDVVESSSVPREEAILTAAYRRFAHYGYSKTTMDEIAGDLGMGKASLYHYFPTKESLFCAVIRREQDSFISLAESLIDGNDSAGEKLYAYVDRRLDFFHNALILGKFSVDAFSSIKPAMTALSEDFARRESHILCAVLQCGVSEGEIADDSPEQLSKLFLHILQGLRFRAFRSAIGDSIDSQQFEELRRETRLATTVFLRGLHPRVTERPLTSPHFHDNREPTTLDL